MNQALQIPVDISPSNLSKLRLVHAAIKLFAEKGIEGTSLRLINRESGAKNNSALHYHFGSKLGVIEATICYIQEWFESTREATLRQLEREARVAPVTIPQIVDALIDPYVILLKSETWGHSALSALARFEFDGDEDVHAILNKTSGKVARRLRKLLRKSCPNLPSAVLDQRLRLCLLIAIQGFADTKNMEFSYIGPTREGVRNYEQIGKLFKTFCVAGLSAPST